jgi:uncharacterized repeat protein (TIGR03803 family)
VFKVNTDGSGYAVLKSFTGSGDGATPRAGLVLAGSTLYGTTYRGGSGGAGVVFKVNTDGSGYTVLKSFDGSDGMSPVAELVLAGSTLYSTTGAGGTSGDGVIFKVNKDGSGFAVLKNFDGSDGRWPYAGLVLAGSTLYGTTSHGGDFDSGVVFSLSLPVSLALVASPQSQTAEGGSTARFTVDATGFPPPAYQWYFNGTNILSSTNTCLELTNVQFARSGAYSAVITNAAGAVTSSPAMFNVIAAVERRPVPGVRVTGQTASLLNVDYVGFLSPAPNWTPLGSVSLTSTSQYCFDLTLPLPPQRYYRAWQTGTPGVMPSLSLPGMVPAITLTGNLGGSLRLDYINQFGPTNAWVTLDTVTLTNSPQLYFDVTMFRQPTRLYRLVRSP